MRTLFRGNDHAIVTCSVFDPMTATLALAINAVLRRDCKATNPLNNGTVLALKNLQFSLLAFLHTLPVVIL